MKEASELSQDWSAQSLQLDMQCDSWGRVARSMGRVLAIRRIGDETKPGSSHRDILVMEVVLEKG